MTLKGNEQNEEYMAFRTFIDTLNTTHIHPLRNVSKCHVNWKPQIKLPAIVSTRNDVLPLLDKINKYKLKD